MTVRDLIEELELMPMDLPVVTDYKEIEEINLDNEFYFLDHSGHGYTVSPAVVLE